jgi:outer membrane immunogenic protein
MKRSIDPIAKRESCVMRNSSLMLFAAAVIQLAANQSTIAADIARGPPSPVYIPPPVPIPYLWTGCYVGGNVGGAWSRIDLTGVSGVNFSATNSGFAGGGQVGCDYQWGTAPWVVGFRNMLNATSLSSSTTFSTIPFTGTVDSRTRWFDTLTARGGYLVIPQVLLYAQGGAAWTNTDITFNSAGSQVGELSNNHTGWTLGAGVEWMFAPHWSVFAEYNFMGFSTQTATFTGCGDTCVVNGNAKADVQDVLAGVNYKF